MNIRYSKYFLKECNQCFYYINLCQNDFKRFENDIIMNINYTPLHNNKIGSIFYGYFVLNSQYPFACNHSNKRKRLNKLFCDHCSFIIQHRKKMFVKGVHAKNKTRSSS